MKEEFSNFQIQKIEIEIERTKNKLHAYYFLTEYTDNLITINNIKSNYKICNFINNNNNNEIHKKLLEKIKTY